MPLGEAALVYGKYSWKNPKVYDLLSINWPIWKSDVSWSSPGPTAAKRIARTQFPAKLPLISVLILWNPPLSFQKIILSIKTKAFNAADI